jgi:hypothetical protein
LKAFQNVSRIYGLIAYNLDINLPKECVMDNKNKSKKKQNQIKNRAGVSQEFIQKISEELLAIRKSKAAAS